MKLRQIFLMTAAVLLITGLIERSIYSQSVHQFNTGYTPQRVYDAKDKKFSDFESMLAELAKSDVVFVGEQHDDPATHRLERIILEGLSRRRPNLIIAMEMFERDVQNVLNEYLAGRISEEEFLKASRPWPRYLTDYKPIIEFARAHGWKVVAGNTPRRLASLVSRQGLPAVDALPPQDRAYVAAQIQCPMDDYYKRFNETMSSHPGSDKKETGKIDKNEKKKQEEQQKAMVDKFYQAQCVKDETMAESIAVNLPAAAGDNSSQRPLVVHYNGSFHSDYRLGTAARVSRRLPKSQVKVVTVIPVDNLDNLNTDEHKKKGDYLLFTLKPMKPPAPPQPVTK
ncbi:MAG: ChaN family lipoprotein [Acidobacteria bacterium]|nr:ChaN family lipoprotein [Acidobacteriota bacterium]